ncbi:histidine phosphatase family protein [Arthrobacter sp. I2-34]|uniref:Histidine phosphatase family protein n=1 Tax=Arthrobacter hankyongi TaxID=2904801 RepID=A0ABS9L2Q0_9MICC|nr:histidine phosphatase family protein [Arthrobacter hankyongi]MCG2620789.1 histidine phosphatase family protein [Arthrobacter hankyongi]
MDNAHGLTDTDGALVLIRHGETDWNAAGRLQGRTDIPLNDVGRGQARDAGAALAGGGWDLLVSSPLQRAVETARIIGAAAGLELALTLPGLLERDYGRCEGEYLNGLSEPEMTPIFGAAEAEAEVAARGVAALRELAGRHPGRRIVAVAHGTLIRLTMSALLGRPHPRVPNAQAVPVDLELLRRYPAAEEPAAVPAAAG